MKKKFLFMMVAACFVTNMQAQDDDVYFVPGKSAEKRNVADVPRTSDARQPEADDDWYKGRVSQRDVDDYNRKGRVDDADALNDSVDRTEPQNDGYYTSRLVRFHSPGLVIVASPYYWDYYDYWYDPWYAGWAWHPWHAGWYGPWYAGWGWHGWYDPWYGWGWHGPGPVWGHYPVWPYRGDSRRGWASGRGGYRRPINGMRTSGTHSFASRGNGSSFGTRRTTGSRSFGTKGTNGVSSGTRTGGNRTFGNGSNTNRGTQRSTRSFNSGRSSAPSRTYTPSTNSGNRNSGGSFGGGGHSSGSRSFGGGGRGGRR